jgi:hypothetical protein
MGSPFEKSRWPPTACLHEATGHSGLIDWKHATLCPVTGNRPVSSPFNHRCWSTTASQPHAQNLSDYRTRRSEEQTRWCHASPRALTLEMLTRHNAHFTWRYATLHLNWSSKGPEKKNWQPDASAYAWPDTPQRLILSGPTPACQARSCQRTSCVTGRRLCMSSHIHCLAFGLTPRPSPSRYKWPDAPLRVWSLQNQSSISEK